MFGTYNYNKIPFGPMGCSVLVHENTNACATWDNHAVYTWYLQTSQYHYRAHVYPIKKTNAERVLDKLVFQHKDTTNPTIEHSDHIIRYIRNP